MKVCGKVGVRQLLILINMGNTRNFMDEKVADRSHQTSTFAYVNIENEEAGMNTKEIFAFFLEKLVCGFPYHHEIISEVESIFTFWFGRETSKLVGYFNFIN